MSKKLSPAQREATATITGILCSEENRHLSLTELEDAGLINQLEESLDKLDMYLGFPGPKLDTQTWVGAAEFLAENLTLIPKVNTAFLEKMASYEEPVKTINKAIHASPENTETYKNMVRDTWKDIHQDGVFDADKVIALQKLLKASGERYRFGKIDGEFGPGTKDALEDFEKEFGDTIKDSELQKAFDDARNNRSKGSGAIVIPGTAPGLQPT